MNRYFDTPEPARRVAGQVPPLNYNPRLRFEGSLPPDIHLINRGVRFESAVPVRRIKAREAIDTKAGEITIVETTRKSATEGAQKAETLVIDDGLGNRLIVAGEVTAEASDQATSQTAVENTAKVEAQSQSQNAEVSVNSVQLDYAQTTNTTVEVQQADTTGGISQSDYLQAQAQQREAERRASATISVGGVPVAPVGTPPSQVIQQQAAAPNPPPSQPIGRQGQDPVGKGAPNQGQTPPRQGVGRGNQ